MNPSASILQLEYKAAGTGETQNERILDALKKWPEGEWCPMPHLAQVASPSGNGVGLAVHSRIADIRRVLLEKGYTIERNIERVDGVTHSFYRISPAVGGAAHGGCGEDVKP